MQSGGGSKDTWVLANGAQSRSEPAHSTGETTFADHRSAGVSSRAADNLFWLGRYTERLEQLLRMLSCVLGRISGESAGEDSNGLRALAELAISFGAVPAVPGASLADGELSRGVLLTLYDADQPGGVSELLKRVRFAASAVRDRFSGDTWRILGRLELDASARPGRLPLASATALIHNLVLDLAAFNGMEMENMTRGHGWRFLDFGRRVERGLSVLNLLRAAATVEPAPTALLEFVLEIADSSMTYRRRYFSAPQWTGVLDLLLRDESNPRSLAFQVFTLVEHTHALVGDGKSAPDTLNTSRLQSLVASLRSVGSGGFEVDPSTGVSERLLDLLNGWAAGLAELSDHVTSQYFSHSVPRAN
jgi:uncharacterized alpha-E superfamily protein